MQLEPVRHVTGCTASRRAPLEVLRDRRSATERRMPPSFRSSPTASPTWRVRTPRSRWLRNVLARQPDTQPAHYALAVMLLSVGEWREGWKHYLRRPRSAERPDATPDQERIVLRAEYGLGDVLFFLRFAPQLRKPFALHLPPQLAKLAPLLAGRIEIADGSGAPTRGLDRRPAVVACRPTATPPAFAVSAQGDDAREKLARLGPPPYLGLTWRAGTDLQRGRELGVDQRVLFKEVPPALLGEAVRGWPGTLVSLQRGPTRLDELEALRERRGRRDVHDLSAVNEDLRDALAVLAVLDDYVAVSNTNIHLRAGLGRTARVLVPNPPEWRWMRTGERLSLVSRLQRVPPAAEPRLDRAAQAPARGSACFCRISATRSGMRIIASCPVSSSKNFHAGSLRYFAANWSNEPVAGEEQ